MTFHLDLAISRIEHAQTIETLADAVRAGLEVLSFDDVAGSIPDRFYDLDALPADLEGLVAFTPTHEIRFDFLASEVVLVERVQQGRAARG